MNIYNMPLWMNRFILKKTLNELEIEKINKIIQAIPDDVNSVLDVGAGSGNIYKQLKRKCFAIDISHCAIKGLNSKNACVGNIKNLPIKSESIDLVLIANIIEHLEENSLIESMEEVMRVSKKYILIDSPYKDSIHWAKALCNKCNREFNVYGHLRSMDIRLIKKLFPKFKILKFEKFGWKRYLRPHFLVYIARRLGKVYSKGGIVCPYCSNTPIIYPHRNFIMKTIGGIVCKIFSVFDKIPSIFREYTEMCVLLRKFRR